jgi:NAD(P)H-quinone oxidoreductase subunit 4L
MSLEIMLNSANINLVGFSRFLEPSKMAGQIFALFVIGVAAAEVAVGLALILAIYRNTRTIFVDKINILKW